MRITINTFSAIIALLIIAPAAHSQGTSGALPDPISTRELTRYADRLMLSDEQRRAVEALHEEYREEFRALREGDIQKFMAQMTRMQGTIPERSVATEFFQDMQRLLGRIRVVDDRFLTRIEPLLTEEQIMRVNRVRMARERTRLRAQANMGGGGRVVDLSDVILDIDLSPSERAFIDSNLAAYEGRLTQLARQHADMQAGMFDRIFDLLEEHGITQETMENPAEMAKMFTVMQEAMGAIFLEMAAMQIEIRQLSRRTLSTIAPMLSERPARALSRAFHQQTYPAATFALGVRLEPLYEAALSLEQVSEEQRTQVRNSLHETRRKLDQLLNDAIREIDKHEGQVSPMDFGSPRHREHADAMSELRQRGERIEESAKDELRLVLGDIFELAEKEAGNMEVAGGSGARRREQVVEAVAGESETPAADRRSSAPPDTYVPAAINAADIHAYARLLRLSPEERLLLEELHRDYEQKFDEHTAAAFEAVRNLRGSQDIEPERIGELRMRAIEAVRRADEQFFNDVALVIIDDESQMERLRMTRERQAMAPRGSMFASFGAVGSHAAGIDLSHVMRLESIDETGAQDALLLEYERELTGLIRRRFAAMIEQQRVNDRWSPRFRDLAPDSENFDQEALIEASMEHQRALAEYGRAINDAARLIVEHNQNSLDRLIAELSAEDGARLRDAYRRRAYPTVYEDAGSPEKHLDSAMRLPELTPDARSRLGEIAAEHRLEYAHLSEQMVAVLSDATGDPFGMGQDREAWASFIDVQNAIAKIRYERNELNARTIRRLRTLLSEDQLALLGPLPEPTEARALWWE